MIKNINGNMIFESQPVITGYASAVGKKEAEGPLSRYFDRVIRDSHAGKDTFEQAESELTAEAVRTALKKADLAPGDIDIACCGDLLNQCVASSFAMRPFAIPYAGVYSACSTMALAMILAATAAESGAARRAVCAASSHYCTAERQYRFPLEYGSQRPPTAQWTVTGAGACVIEANPPYKTVSQPSVSDRPQGAAASQESLPLTPRICSARLGRIIDYDITDQNNMGAAMAPAVVKIGTIRNPAKTA